MKCNHKRCLRAQDKKLSRQERAKVLIDFISDLLNNHLEVDRSIYDEYKSEANTYLLKERERLTNELRIVSRRLTEIAKDIEINFKRKDESIKSHY